MTDEIRSEFEHTLLHTPWERVVHEIGGREIHYFLNEGALQAHTTNHLQTLHCGCLGNPGGVCSGCLHPICQICLVRCLSCRRPVGPCCFRLFHDPAGNPLPFCGECYRAVRRKNTMRLLLSPFVRFHDEP